MKARIVADKDLPCIECGRVISAGLEHQLAGVTHWHLACYQRAKDRPAPQARRANAKRLSSRS